MPKAETGDTVKALSGPLSGRVVYVAGTDQNGAYVTADESSGVGWYLSWGDMLTVGKSKARTRAGERARSICNGCGNKKAACKCLELHLERDLKTYGVPVETENREYEFAPGRKFRADFAWIEHRLLVEVEGGTFRSRHREAAGFAVDCEKYNIAAEQGFYVMRFDSKMVKNGTAAMQIARWINLRSDLKGVDR